MTHTNVIAARRRLLLPAEPNLRPIWGVFVLLMENIVYTTIGKYNVAVSHSTLTHHP